jgi:hypothetical protein
MGEFQAGGTVIFLAGEVIATTPCVGERLQLLGHHTRGTKASHAGLRTTYVETKRTYGDRNTVMAKPRN